jgi:TolB-like protein
VALKLVPSDLAASSERLERFQREAEVLATLNHPNIVTIYSVEKAAEIRFLTMELVEGRSLEQMIPEEGMELGPFFDVAIPLAEALSSAHEKGITHRDLKPANVMLSDEGRVKVLDFGLAKLLEAEPAPMATQVPTEALTQEGVAVGTVPYMSPEQIEGKEVDHRTDIFSLGILLYEMASGQRPFAGDSSPALMSSILKDHPSSVTELRDDLPRHLGRILEQCLEKDSRDRIQTARDVYNQLRSLRREVDSGTAFTGTHVAVQTESAPVEVKAPPAEEKILGMPHWMLMTLAGMIFGLVTLWMTMGRDSQSDAESGAEPPVVSTADRTQATGVSEERKMIVVLPFETLGPAEQGYFADGMTEEITSRLASVGELGVISRTSAMQYKENRPPIDQIAEELGVGYVLEGTVRWAGAAEGAGRVRITTQLIEVEDDTHLWAENYDRVLDDMR